MTPGMWLTTLPATALPDVLKAYDNRLRHVYLESPTRVVMLPYAESSAQWQQAYHGRAFGPALEVRWRRLEIWTAGMPFILDVRILWEEGAAPADLLEHGIKWSASEWNTLFEPTPRPRILLLADRPNSVLRCSDYLCDGIVVLTRLCDIVPH